MGKVENKINKINLDNGEFLTMPTQYGAGEEKWCRGGVQFFFIFFLFSLYNFISPFTSLRARTSRETDGHIFAFKRKKMECGES